MPTIDDIDGNAKVTDKPAAQASQSEKRSFTSRPAKEAEIANRLLQLDKGRRVSSKTAKNNGEAFRILVESAGRIYVHAKQNKEAVGDAAKANGLKRHELIRLAAAKVLILELQEAEVNDLDLLTSKEIAGWIMRLPDDQWIDAWAEVAAALRNPSGKSQNEAVVSIINKRIHDYRVTHDISDGGRPKPIQRTMEREVIRLYRSVLKHTPKVVVIQLDNQIKTILERYASKDPIKKD